MKEERRSSTAEGAAIMRALHQTLDEDPRILVDPIAPRLIEPQGDFYKGALADFELLPLPIRSRFRSLFVIRSRYADACLAESLSDGVLQYVILGAGLDTFAYRQPLGARSLRVFDVDYPPNPAMEAKAVGRGGYFYPEQRAFGPSRLRERDSYRWLVRRRSRFHRPYSQVMFRLWPQVERQRQRRSDPLCRTAPFGVHANTNRRRVR